MRRFWFLALLMVLSRPAYAGSFSFSIGGHRIHIESSRYCRSTSCASVSISGIYQSRRDRDLYDDDNRDTVDPVKAPTAPTQTAPPIIAAAPANNPAVRPAVAAPPPAVFKPAASATQIVAAPPPPPAVPRVEKPAEAVRPAPAAGMPVLEVSHHVQDQEDEPAHTPVGDWLTEAKGTVRIVKCGRALCGYVLNTSSDDKGEAVLVNMKPKTDTRWTGSVYSHDSGDTYYGTMDIKGRNTLRVEACALGRFYCSGNNWTRITARNEPMMSSRQTLPEPRS
ncbi:DUF2147 domain-containing protein [Bradyrhizobium sp. Ash2021]|uniref:DUF2147 domain-containing protein n=1 Tax=Bradyrhizobium sp. Ash2021 TaxID=2954771 RepID=UPI0028164383|nr:DUF2147 domain-containing protein [Bradyrhizobium sp. Ash2021]WMT73164.1 DUF2147 domain-containing protein [Bradyrhizobium sp. Ash2021]